MGVGLQPQTQQTVTASQYLMVVGQADLDSHTASLQSLYTLSQSATLPLPTPGDWTIALVNSGGTDLATYPFTPNELTDAVNTTGHPAVISELVPWVDGTVKVEIRYLGSVVATRNASAHAPTVSITSPTGGTVLPSGPFNLTWTGSDQDGNPLTYSVLYSVDGGTSWQTLATGLSATLLALNTDQLPGGSAMFRVIASDGLLTGQDTSGAVTVPKHAPTVHIVTPSQNQVFYPSQQIVLQGTAYDLEDGTLGDASLHWSSSVDGDLGTGATLNVPELTTGQHVITLSATDSDGMSSQAQVTINVAEAGTPKTPNLDASPFMVGLVIGIGSPATPYTVTLRSSGDMELNWTASENIPWLTLNSTTGTTPTDLVLTIDPSLLSVGTNTGTITLTSNQAVNSPVQLMVSVQMTGYALQLPLITK